jgi:hypothetical protein
MACLHPESDVGIPFHHYSCMMQRGRRKHNGTFLSASPPSVRRLLCRHINHRLHGRGVNVAVVMVGPRLVELQGEGLPLSHVLRRVEGAGSTRIARHRVGSVTIVNPQNDTSSLNRDGDRLKDVVPRRILHHLHDGSTHRHRGCRCGRGRWSRCGRWSRL